MIKNTPHDDNDFMHLEKLMKKEINETPDYEYIKLLRSVAVEDIVTQEEEYDGIQMSRSSQATDADIAVVHAAIVNEYQTREPVVTILAKEDSDKYLLSNGAHTLAAHKLAGYTHIPAVVVRNTGKNALPVALAFSGGKQNSQRTPKKPRSQQDALNSLGVLKQHLADPSDYCGYTFVWPEDYANYVAEYLAESEKKKQDKRHNFVVPPAPSKESVDAVADMLYDVLLNTAPEIQDEGERRKKANKAAAPSFFGTRHLAVQAADVEAKLNPENQSKIFGAIFFCDGNGQGLPPKKKKDNRQAGLPINQIDPIFLGYTSPLESPVAKAERDINYITKAQLKGMRFRTWAWDSNEIDTKIRKDRDDYTFHLYNLSVANRVASLHNLSNRDRNKILPQIIESPEDFFSKVEIYMMVQLPEDPDNQMSGECFRYEWYSFPQNLKDKLAEVYNTALGIVD